MDDTRAQCNQVQFTFERLDAYRVACEVLEIGIEQRSRLKGMPGEVASQLERALVSTVANLAEGAGRDSRADRRRHFAIARGSATESGALVEIAWRCRILPDDVRQAMRSRLLRVVGMLTGLMAK